MRVRRVLPLIMSAVAVLSVFAVASTAFATGASLPLSIKANKKTFPVPAAYLSLDTSGYASAVDTAGITTWITKAVAPTVGVNHKIVDWKVDYKATKKLNNGKLGLVHNAGFKLDTVAAVSAITSALWAETSSTAPSTLTLTSVKLRAEKKLGRMILVDQSKRRIYVYDNDKLHATFRCAVGQAAYPTLNGIFYIGKKNPAPTWTNPFAPWSMGMPAFIGPGPNNPLGTRALYIYGTTGKYKNKDTGERFHGVPHDEDDSIGTAASHGCFRMHRKDVEKFYPMIKVGTMVYVVP